jgi:hypothetical protein
MATGIDAIASVLPALTPLRLSVELGAIGLIVLLNLRDLPSAGPIFAAPTHLFLVSFGLMLAVGVGRALSQSGLTAAIPPKLPASMFRAPVPRSSIHFGAACYAIVPEGSSQSGQRG